MEKKICPLNIGKLSMREHLKSLFKRDYVLSSFCRKEECAWWDEDANKCGMLAITDIANAIWDE